MSNHSLHFVHSIKALGNPPVGLGRSLRLARSDRPSVSVAVLHNLNLPFAPIEEDLAFIDSQKCRTLPDSSLFVLRELGRVGAILGILNGVLQDVVCTRLVVLSIRGSAAFAALVICSIEWSVIAAIQYYGRSPPHHFIIPRATS